MVGLQLTPPRKERLADILYGQIFEQILSGAFKEGDRLPTEHEISSAFDVSRPVVREALIRLQADGLIYARRGAGTFHLGHGPGERRHSERGGPRRHDARRGHARRVDLPSRA